MAFVWHFRGIENYCLSSKVYSITLVGSNDYLLYGRLQLLVKIQRFIVALINILIFLKTLSARAITTFIWKFIIFLNEMLLRYFLNDKKERVYTLKVCLRFSL